MARAITLTSGSIMNGNPITFSVSPNVITGKDEDGNLTYPSFHRVIMDVCISMSYDSQVVEDVIKMSSPVESENTSTVVNIDISSALRSLRDSYEYTPTPTTYPLVSFKVKAYDEYMLNGETVTNAGVVTYPSDNTLLRTIFGAFSDMVRLLSNGQKVPSRYSRKPSTPHLAAVGEDFVYAAVPSPGWPLVSSSTLKSPQSISVSIANEGMQTLGGHSVYALPASEAQNRQVFRFINSFGVLESISVPKTHGKNLAVTSTGYLISRQETFNSFSRLHVRKQNNRETWHFSTDPIDEDWLSWYLHEFMMSEHIWILVKNTWIPCTITPEEDASFLDETNRNYYTVAFSVQLGINGSPTLTQ